MGKAKKHNKRENEKKNKNKKNKTRAEKVRSFLKNYFWILIIVPVLIELLKGGILSAIENHKPSHFFMIADLHTYVCGYVEDELIPIYWSNDAACTLLELSVSNGNEVTVDIKNIIIEVTDYKALNEFVVKNPVGGADLKEIFTWECNISPEKEKYYSTFTGTEQDRAEEMLKTSYVAVSPGDTGEFDVKIYPDTPGLYEIKATVEYTYKDRVEKKESKSKKFIFDPELELQMENVIGVQDEKKITAYGRLYRYGRTGRMYSQI